MTKRAICRAIYDRRVDLTKVSDHPGRSGPEDGNSSLQILSITLIC